MKLFKPLLLAIALALSGCSANPTMKVTTRMFNFGIELTPEMVGANMVGVIGFDEDFAGNYGRLAKNALYGQGIEEGVPEYQYRVVRVNIQQTNRAGWYAPGRITLTTGAMVPDHLPRLRAGDIIEIRQTGTYETMKDFARINEGNIIVRLLCPKAAPDYEACVDRQPSIGKYKTSGFSRTPYPASVKEYGFTFTPAYDTTGKLLRPLP